MGGRPRSDHLDLRYKENKILSVSFFSGPPFTTENLLVNQREKGTRETPYSQMLNLLHNYMVIYSLRMMSYLHKKHKYNIFIF